MDKTVYNEKFRVRLKELMTEKGDTIYTLAKYLGLSPSAISRYTTGEVSPKLTALNAMADRYRVNPVWLMGYDIDRELPEQKKASMEIPLIGSVAAGLPMFAEENVEDYLLVDETENVDFALKVRGDSMINARIYDGDIIFVRKQPVVENGEIAVVLVDDEATIKRYYKYDDMVILRPENSSYKEQVYTKRDCKNILIQGKVVFLKYYVK